MAGLFPGDPAHHGIYEGGPYNIFPDKPEEVGCWYLSRKEIEENSPSRRDGIDLKKETYLRKSYCTFLQDLGMRLKVPQVTIATAIIFCHRFFLRQSHVKNNRMTIATVCMFLAGKVEETPRPLKDVILVSYEIIHKKDPAAVQRIKHKEVYEQQKELILLGERVVLATLGFDFNVHHPYKPLVEAIKKFMVAQNALAQVAWNFVNDGLRTSLCLQFKPHHIAAGAIFLAAKFLKVKLPSDGEKVWWQEFDVTPRQLEEVSNQMLELYEQNRVLPSQGSEVEGSAGGGASHRPPPKTTAANEEQVSNNGYAQGVASSIIKPGTLKPLSSRSASDQSYAHNQGGPQRSTQSRSNDYGSTEMRSVVSDQNIHGEVEHHQAPEQEPLPQKDVEGAANKYKLERFGEEEQEPNGGRIGIMEAGKWKENGPSSKSLSMVGRNSEYREGLLGQSPQDAIKKIDKDKVKAALEKRRKSRGDIARKMDMMDEDDLIERELEDGIELAAEDEKIKRERRHCWSNPSSRLETENYLHYSNDQDDTGDGNYLGMKGQSSRGHDTCNVEEGEVSIYDDGDKGLRSPKLGSRKRKVGSSLDKQLDGKQRHEYAGYLNHHDIVEDVSKMGRLGYADRDH